MKERPILFSGPMVRAILEGRKTQTRRIMPNILAQCPYGVPGDRLWVRETHAARYFDNGAPAYRADWASESADVVKEPRWTPAIHMPRALSRIDLEVTAVRVERLQAITEEDARREGLDPTRAETLGFDMRQAFHALWDAINGKRAPWTSNPWVWVVSFERRRP